MRAGIKCLESGKKNAERADLLPFPSSPAPAIFQFPFPLPFSHFVAVSTRVEPPRRKEVSNDLTEHSRFRSQALMWAFMIVAACLSHILFFLEDVNGIACRTGVIVFFFFCVLQAGTTTSPKHEAGWGRIFTTGLL